MSLHPFRFDQRKNSSARGDAGRRGSRVFGYRIRGGGVARYGIVRLCRVEGKGAVGGTEPSDLTLCFFQGRPEWSFDGLLFMF